MQNLVLAHPSCWTETDSFDTTSRVGSRLPATLFPQLAPAGILALPAGLAFTGLSLAQFSPT